MINIIIADVLDVIKPFAIAAGLAREIEMNAGWKFFWLAVPDVVSVGYAEGPRPLWSLATAFMLRAIDLMAAGVAIIALVLMLGEQPPPHRFDVVRLRISA